MYTRTLYDSPHILWRKETYYKNPSLTVLENIKSKDDSKALNLNAMRICFGSDYNKKPNEIITYWVKKESKLELLTTNHLSTL